jgi:phosphoenolpyruvate carboxykinase (ATP)
MPLHASRYATMLAERLTWHETDCWLVNTGWIGGSYGTGHRMSIDLTRALISAALDGSLATSGFTPHPVFKVHVPNECNSCPADVLDPRASWADGNAYDAAARTLAGMFRENFEQYAEHVAPEVLAAGPDPAVGVE